MAIFNGYISLSRYQREGLEFLMVSAQDTDFIDEKMGYFELKGGFRRPSCGSVVGFKWLGLAQSETIPTRGLRLALNP